MPTTILIPRHWSAVGMSSPDGDGSPEHHRPKSFILSARLSSYGRQAGGISGRVLISASEFEMSYLMHATRKSAWIYFRWADELHRNFHIIHTEI